jgi:hypothetical protein
MEHRYGQPFRHPRTYPRHHARRHRRRRAVPPVSEVAMTEHLIALGLAVATDVLIVAALAGADGTFAKSDVDARYAKSTTLEQKPGF